MPDLSEQIREYVDAVDETVSIYDVGAVLDRRSGRRSGRNRHHRRRTGLLVGACAVLLVAAILFQVLPISGRHPSSDASAVLTHAAAVAAAQATMSVPKQGQYRYYQVTNGVETSAPEPVGVRQFSFLSTETTDSWVAPNGSGRQRIDVTRQSLLVPSDRPAWLAAGSPKRDLGTGVTDNMFPSMDQIGGPLVAGADGEYYLSYLDSSKFPTHPAALQQYMKRYFKITGGGTTTFLLAGDLLQVGASPSLRSALFQMIEHLPGVKVLGTTKDAAGREGQGVVIDGYGNQYILVFNAKTSAVLGEKILANRTTTHFGEKVPKGTLIGFETFGDTGIASSTSTFPDGKSAPAYNHQENSSGIGIQYSGPSPRRSIGQDG